MMRTRVICLVCLTLASGLFSAACGSDARSPVFPPTSEGALQQLDYAEGQIAGALGQYGQAQQPAPQGQPPPGLYPPQPGQAPPPPPPPAPPSVMAPLDDKPNMQQQGVLAGGETQVNKSAASPCETACRALASMTSATDHLCILAGEADSRCTGARARTKNATERVRAQCPACS